MEKTFVLVLLLVTSTASFSQAKKEKTGYDKAYYLKKRSQNNTTAHFLFWSGLAAAITGNTIDQNVNFEGSGGWFNSRYRGTDKYKHTGAVIAYSGLVCMVGSIPFFYFAAKNRRTASSLSFKSERVPALSKQGFVYQTVPSVALIIEF